MREPKTQTRIFNPGSGRYESIRVPLDRPAPADHARTRTAPASLLYSPWQVPATLTLAA